MVYLKMTSQHLFQNYKSHRSTIVFLSNIILSHVINFVLNESDKWNGLHNKTLIEDKIKNYRNFFSYFSLPSVQIS